MNTKKEKCLLSLCIVLTVITIILAAVLSFFNPNEFVPNKDKFKIRENHDRLTLTAIGEGMFCIDHLRYYPALEIIHNPADRNSYELILDYIIDYEFENENFYCYAEDGYAIVYAESNLCKVFITPPTNLSLDGMNGRIASNNYRIGEILRDEYPENKLVVYLNSFDEFTEYEQKMLKSLEYPPTNKTIPHGFP